MEYNDRKLEAWRQKVKKQALRKVLGEYAVILLIAGIGFVMLGNSANATYENNRCNQISLSC